MNDVYLFGKNRSTFPPQERTAVGEVHEDWQLFGYDRARGAIVLRQFHVGTFVIH